MKYLITESQINNLVFKYLENQDFVSFKTNKDIYFMNTNEDEYGKIRFDKKDSECYISKKLVDEVSEFFSMDNSDSKELIGRWFENTIKMKVKDIYMTPDPSYTLRTPYYG